MTSIIAQAQEITKALDYTIALLKAPKNRTELEIQVLANLERIREGLDGN